MLERGYRVISLASTSPTGRIRGWSSRAIDLFDAEATAGARGRDRARRTRVTHIVHNAGVIRPNPVEAAKAGDIAALAQLHLGGGAAACCRRRCRR